MTWRSARTLLLFQVSLRNGRRSECPGYCATERVGRAKTYDHRTPLAADLLNDRLIPFHGAHDIPSRRVLTDRGTENCETRDRRAETAPRDNAREFAAISLTLTLQRVLIPQTSEISYA